MKSIFVDFEMHPLNRKYKMEREICKQEIIEIGAIVWDDNYQEIASFKRYVKPLYSQQISKRIVELTGITDGFLFGCKELTEELDAFAKWCLSFDDEFIVYAWSENDLNQIIAEYRLKNFAMSEELEKVLDNWHDLQFDYDKAISSEKSTSLSKALESLGIYFDGKMHDALDDARNTATVFKELSNPEEFQRTVSYINEHKNVSTTVTTLGELLDFSMFKFD